MNLLTECLVHLIISSSVDHQPVTRPQKMTTMTEPGLRGHPHSLQSNPFDRLVTNHQHTELPSGLPFLVLSSKEVDPFNRKFLKIKISTKQPKSKELQFA